MRLLKRFTPSPAMVIACMALLLVLGGTGYAASKALPRNSVTTVQVKDRSLLARDFKAADHTTTYLPCHYDHLGSHSRQIVYRSALVVHL